MYVFVLLQHNLPDVFNNVIYLSLSFLIYFFITFCKSMWN